MANEDPAILTKALESLLIEKGLITAARIGEIVKNYEEDIGPMRGAQVVARAWSDADYRTRLLADGRAAIAEFGFTDAHGAELMVTENTDEVHKHRRVHVVLLLPLVCARSATDVVQVLCLPVACCQRAASRAEGIWPGAARVDGG